jgi:hypothetical protein
MGKASGRFFTYAEFALRNLHKEMMRMMSQSESKKERTYDVVHS